MAFIRRAIRRPVPAVGAFLLVAAFGTACSVETAEFSGAAAMPVSGPGDDPGIGDDETGRDASSGEAALDPIALDPSALGSSALGSSALDPSALDPSALDSSAAGSSVMDPAADPPADLSFTEPNPASDNDPRGQADGAEQADGLEYGSAASVPLTTEADVGLPEADKISRGALLIETFGLVGGRLTSDAARICTHDRFSAASAPLRIDQIVAGMPTTETDVALLVGALDDCGGLRELASILGDELAEGLDDLFVPSIAKCIDDFYAEADELVALLTAGIDRHDAELGVSALAECVGLGDLLAADEPFVGTSERLCLNERGAVVIEALITVEVREEVVSFDPGVITQAVAECLPGPAAGTPGG